jgi:serine/threonine protein kinase/Flp pilus assembly protein TadD
MTNDGSWDRLAARLAGSADVLADLRHHQVAGWEAGAGPPAEEYLSRFPHLPSADKLSLIVAEIQIRRSRGDQAPADEYRSRFPALPELVDLELLLAIVADADESPEVDGYLLGERIGRGGMGVVFRARDLELDRDVAVKVLQSRHSSSGSIASRFLDEARITAQLQHPGVPPVYRSGKLPDGRPFLAMKLIKGRTLADLVADPKADRGRLVAAFEQVAATVGYAHAHGVLHRDLKPDNVMVGKFGEVQVMDWGMSKVMGAAETAAAGVPTSGSVIRSNPTAIPTPGGEFLGTPHFMAPEQAIGAVKLIDTRSDVFGLGGILCVILTGRPPFEGESNEGTRLLAAQGKVGPCFRRLDACEADPELVALCKRCLAREKEDRPADAGVVATAVSALRAAADDRARRAEIDREKAEVREEEEKKRREVETRLTEAKLAEERGRRESEILRQKEQLAAERKRRRVVQWAGGVTVTVLLAGVIGTAIGLFEARKQEAEAKKQTGIARDETMAKETALREEEKQRGIAEAKQAEAEKAAAAETLAKEDEAKQRAKAEKAYAKTADVLDVMVSQITGKSLETQKAVSKEQKTFLTEVLTYYREFAATKGEDSKTRLRAAKAAYSVGTIEYRLGRKKESAAAFRQALNEFENVVARFPDVPAYQADLAGAHNSLGVLLAGLGKWAEAEEQHLHALAIQEKLVANFPANPDYRQDLAGSQTNLGKLLKSLGKRAEAVGQYRKAVALFERLFADFPADPDYRSGLALSLNGLGELLKSLGKRTEAEEQYRKGLAIREKLAADFPTVPDYRQDLATSHNALGNLLNALGESAEAEGQHRKGLAIREKLAADFPTVPDYRQDLARSHTNLGGLLAAGRKRAEAEGQYRKAVALFEKLSADFPADPDYQVDLGGSYCHFGSLVRDGGKPADSLAWFRKAIDTLRPVHEQEQRDVKAKEFLRFSYGGRAIAYDLLQNYADAVKDWDRVVELSPAGEQPLDRVYRALSKVNAGQVVEAVAEVSELRKLDGWPPDLLYNFVRVCSVASDKVEREKQNYADLAVELLQAAVKAGWKEYTFMKKDAALAPLHGREDFQKLLAELEAKFPPPREVLPPPRK